MLLSPIPLPASTTNQIQAYGFHLTVHSITPNHTPQLPPKALRPALPLQVSPEGEVFLLLLSHCYWQVSQYITRLLRGHILSVQISVSMEARAHLWTCMTIRALRQMEDQRRQVRQYIGFEQG